MATPDAGDTHEPPGAPDDDVDEGLKFPYTEVPIDSARHQIRLLTLRAGEWSTPVSCTLSSASLDNKPAFKALSYAWGDDDTSADIIINGQPFSVYKNLDTILHRLRRGPGGKDMVLWIDAICINQAKKSKEAVAERTSQLQMMATIYSCCREVLVWLGNCYTDRLTPVRFLTRDSDNKHLLQEYAADFERDATTLDYCFHLACFLYLLKDAGRKLDLASYELPPFWASRASHRLSRYKIPHPTEVFKRIYANRMYLLCRYIGVSSWTTRLWTLQEYGVSPQITLCFGTAAVPQERFSDMNITKVTNHGNGDDLRYWSSLFSISCNEFVRGLHEHILTRNSVAIYRPRAPGSILPAIVSTVFRPVLRRLTKKIARRVARFTVFELVATFRQAQASKGQDKVFAIVSFMTFMGLKVPDDLQINCELDTSEIYFRVSKNQILKCKGDAEAYEPLAPLRFAREKNKPKPKPKDPKPLPIDLPSWAVDWTSYPWGDQHVIPAALVRSMPPELAPWLHLEAKPEVQGPEPKEDWPARLVSAAQYNATKGFVGANPSIEGRVLTVSGIAVGRVTEVFDFAESSKAWKLAWTWPARRVPRRVGTTPTMRDRRAAVLRTLCADMLGPQDWAAKMEVFWLELGAAFEVALKSFEEPVSFAFLVDNVREMIERRVARGGWTGDNAATFNAPRFVEQLDSMLRFMKIMSHGNSLFVTDSGRLGLGGKDISVQEQDQVYVLYQGRTPFVLRPRQMDESTSRFQLVSECFVDGLMQGEAAGLGGDLQRIEID
ncbi:hypothetical protein EPUS_00001 [Endocarpon pusillum Z07020]|uniref:Heterokaryon incompatibility domain-containing protein n=1 Tax=Endocarpon pusillum (strain Z07020 / HMAS-L-300199) TaxID=1263415 RepID=U1I051_ENDPU|nr:uncharacterized protein EPUS_00001 [Endocarpon pusillum Z07020]ERF75209.1 hypothetical protein EPUS_00001 [Endocarpon pusillum Z07020]